MKWRTRRRIIGFSVLAAVSAIFLVINETMRISLGNTNHFSGWVLLALMLLLAGYNLRKKFPVPPLISSRAWLQVHIYAGLFTFVAFIAHAGLGLPNGALDSALAFLYYGVALSGVAGLVITRIFPKRLTSRGQEAIFERLPEIRRDIRERAERLVERSIVETEASTIASFYTERLRHFFGGPRYRLRHVVSYTSALSRQMTEIEDQYRYLNKEERKIMREIADLVRMKDALDHQHALQLVLKLWLFVHIPLTYCLIVVTAMHVLMVYAFSGRVL